RRLEEGVLPIVPGYSAANRAWGTHDTNFTNFKDTLLPPTDRSVSTLLSDLHDRGMLAETLVIWTGDMGRTPRGHNAADREHWSFCCSLPVPGGGVRGAQVRGSPDRNAASTSANPVTPADLTATIYHCLGIDPRAHVTDQQGRPLTASTGTPVHGVLG